MPTLVFTPRYTDDSQALWKEAARRGWTTERLTTWRVPAHLKDLPDAVLYGEALFGPTLADELGLVLANPPEDWLVRLPHEYKRREIALTTMDAARASPEARFVKPPNDKSFPAGVYRGAALPAEYPGDMPVLVSDVVRWEKEFRCFVLGRELKTFSIYSRFGELQRDGGFASTAEEDLAMRGFVDALLADERVDLPHATVVDVGSIEGLGWACVEQNAAWGAGIYGCDPGAVLEVLRGASTRRRAHPSS